MNDQFFLDEVSRFVGSALRSAQPVVVIASEATRDGLADRLQAQRLDLGSLASRGYFVADDSVKALSRVMRGGCPDHDALAEIVDELECFRVAAASEPGCRLTIVGEMNVPLCQMGAVDAAIEVERIWDELTSGLAFFTVCSYPADCFGEGGAALFGRICAVHSAVTRTPDSP
jgi:hypothetical protein